MNEVFQDSADLKARKVLVEIPDQTVVSSVRKRERLDPQAEMAILAQREKRVTEVPTEL